MNVWVALTPLISVASMEAKSLNPVKVNSDVKQGNYLIPVVQD